MPNTNWPPIDWLWRAHAQNMAWYSGDPAQLARSTTGFWRGKERIKTHVPIAHELAALAGSMLFAGSPVVTHPDERVNARLQCLLNENRFYALLLQAAELQAALGGVFLKINWDTALAQRPILTVIPASAGLPTYQNGILTGCTFWGTVRSDDKTRAVWRLCEVYTPDGRILSTLYKGDAENLGGEVSLDAIPETRSVLAEAASGAKCLLATYVPGRLPNRFDPSTCYGMSDFHGLYTLFSALDEVYSAMLRDVRLGKCRVIVPMEFLRRKQDMLFAADQGPASHFAFDSDEEIFTALDINPQDSGAGVTFLQPLLRTAEYKLALDDLVRRIFSMAGYSPQSAGLDIEGCAESGTALNVRERRSAQTIEAKKAYWWHALLDITRALLAVDAQVFHQGGTTDDITVAFADNTQPDTQTIADTLDKLERAGAASTRTKVRMLHPDWDDDGVAEEAALIREERGLTGDDPLDAGLGDMEDAPGGDT
ncbi:MAG: phage portal protein [Clostridia bacterium]